MSLINNMLKDLEARKNEQRDNPPIYLTAVPRRERYYNFSINNTHIAIGLSILTVLALATAIFFHKKPRQIAPMLATDIQTPLTNPDNHTEWLKSGIIKGITIQVKDNITELTFLLDHPVLYHLDSNEMKNQLSLVIEDAKLEAELPPTAYLNSGIQHFNVEQIKNDSRFSFELSPDASIKYVNLSSEEKNPELVIAIQNPHGKASGSISQPVSAPVKTQALQSLLAQRYQVALGDAENGNYKGAIQNLTAMLEMDPEYKDARVSLAALLIDQGRSIQAKKVINAGLVLNPYHLPFIELKARLLTQEGKVQEALSLLQSASPPIADNPEYHAFIAALFERTNNNTLAVTLYQKLLAINNHNGSWWFGLALSLDKSGQQKSAIDAYSRAITEGHLSPESITYLQNRLKALQESPNEKG